MEHPEAAAECSSCHRQLSFLHFLSAAGARRIHRRCRNCRGYQPYTRSVSNTPTDQLDVRTSPLDDPSTSAVQHAPPMKLLKEEEEEEEPDYIDLTLNNEDEAVTPLPSVGFQAPSPVPAIARSSADSSVAALSIVPSEASSESPSAQSFPSCPITGLSLSGACGHDTPFVQNLRRFVVPKDVKRIKQEDFRKLNEPLEEGMVVRDPSCSECRRRGIHCTYGAGIKLDGTRRDSKKGKCDLCKHNKLKCRSKNAEQQQAESNTNTNSAVIDAEAELLKAISQVDAKSIAYIQARADGIRGQAPSDPILFFNRITGLGRTLQVLLGSFNPAPASGSSAAALAAGGSRPPSASGAGVVSNPSTRP